MEDNEICKENVCKCLFDVLIRGNISDRCVYNPNDEFFTIQGSVDEYGEDYNLEDPERLVVLSLDEKDSFKIADYIYTKVLRIMYDSNTVFNTKSLERFDMNIYLMKHKDWRYLDFGEYAIYHKGSLIYTNDCPPTINIIAEAYGKISGERRYLIIVLNMISKAYKKLKNIRSTYLGKVYRDYLWN